MIEIKYGKELKKQLYSKENIMIMTIFSMISINMISYIKLRKILKISNIIGCIAVIILFLQKIKIKKLYNKYYLKIYKEKISITNFYGKTKTIMICELNNIDITKKQVNLSTDIKNYKINFKYVDVEYINQIKSFFKELKRNI